MKTIETRLLIDASKEDIWRVLTDFDAYPRWNTFVKSISGDPVLGAKLCVRICLKGDKCMAFKPTVLEVVDNTHLSWNGALLFSALFNGTHQFTLNEQPNGQVEFIHKEDFKGWIVPLLWSKISSDTLSGFERFNQELKQEIERQKIDK